MTGLPAHVRTHLETTTGVDPTGTRRAAARTTCRTCRAPVIRALDGDVLAFEVTADPIPLDPVGELLAIAAGRRTYDAVTVRGRIELEPRRPTHIPIRRHPILADHHCGHPIPAAVTTDADAQEATNDAPPF